MIPTHLETWDSEEFEIAGSIYMDENQEVSLWIKVGVAVMEIPLELADEVSELIKAMGETAHQYAEEVRNVN